ncbi:MAG: LysR family transcriptional regulator [Oscillospiraceae bacterium]|nr:LysR family transcriptional regulator [Oscillospiraceae bacterium]
MSTSQPSVTRCIKNLEYHLGCRLFIRSTKGVKLTPEGETLYRHVSPACELIFKGEETLGSALSLQSGSVYLGATETAIHCFLLEKLEQFHRAYPHVGIKITNATTPPILHDLKNGRIDLAVVTTPVAEETRLQISRIKKFRDVLVGGPNLVQPDQRKVKLCDLSRYPLICLSGSTVTYRFYSEFYVRHGVPFQPDIELATADLLLPFVEKNLGVGFVPEELACEAVKRGKAVQIELEETIPPRYICVIRDRQNPLSAAAKQMVKILMETEKRPEIKR